MSYLREFFAVTWTSLYRVACNENPGESTPIVEKMALRNNSNLPVGKRLRNGRFVGVRRDCICLYEDEQASDSRRPRPPEELSTYFYGGHTTPIVALFLRRRDAERCLRTGSTICLDPRWKKQTLAVVRAIGDDHPVFILSRGQIGINEENYPA